MKRTILIILMVVLFVTPCLAQEIEPDAIHRLHGTAWMVTEVWLEGPKGDGFGVDIYQLAFYGRYGYRGSLVDGEMHWRLDPTVVFRVNLLDVCFFGLPIMYFQIWFGAVGITTPEGIGVIFTYNTPGRVHGPTDVRGEWVPARIAFGTMIRWSVLWKPPEEEENL